MSRLSANQRLTPSILDRLMTDVEGGRPLSITFDLQQMIDVVRRDLEDLLNTRRTARPSVEAFEETRTSVVAYGMPDLASVNAATESDRREVGRIIEEVIQRCEPRLRDVHAHLTEDGSGGSGRAVQLTSRRGSRWTRRRKSVSTPCWN